MITTNIKVVEHFVEFEGNNSAIAIVKLGTCCGKISGVIVGKK